MKTPEAGPREPKESQENTNQNDNPPRISRRGFLKAAAGAIAGSSVLGRAAETSASEKSESDAEKKESKELEKDALYLGERIGEISKEGIENITDGVAIKENGNMVVHLGKGIYYEISKSDRSELFKIRGLRDRRKMSEDLNESLKKMESGHLDATKRKDFERAKETLNHIKRTNEIIDNNDNQADKLISDNIRRIGRRFENGDVPKVLSDFEQKRVQAKEKIKEKE